MRSLVAILVAALFSAVTLSAYAADESGQGSQSTQPKKHAKKKKKSQPSGVQQGAPAAEGRGTPGGAATGGAVQQGAPAAEGRGTPGGAATGGGVTSPTPTGPGRANNQ
jgi:hypothetical protein